MNTNIQPPINQSTVQITRSFNLPVSKIWQACTEPESIKEWYGPRGFTCPFSTIDLKPGGKYLNCMRSPEGEEFWSTGIFKEIVPFKKLVYTDSFSDREGNIILASDLNMPGNWPVELLITITLVETNGKTELSLHQEGVPKEMQDECARGWQQSFDKLEQRIHVR